MRKEPHLRLTIFCLFFLVAAASTSGVLLDRPRSPVLAAVPARPDIGEFVAFCPYSHRAPAVSAREPPYPGAALAVQAALCNPGRSGHDACFGAAFTAHGDFFNAWEPAALANRLHCLYDLVKCGPEGLPDGQPTAESTPEATTIATTEPTGEPTVGPTVESTLTPTLPHTPTIIPTVPVSAPTAVIFAPLVQP